MNIRQISLFLENRPGALRRPCEALGQAGIDILTLSLADTQQFGILRLVVRDDEAARRVLEEAGFVVRLTELLAVEVPDRPGGLAGVFRAFERAGISVEYCYPMQAGQGGGTAVLLVRVEDPEGTARALTIAGVRVLSRDEVMGQGGA